MPFIIIKNRTKKGKKSVINKYTRRNFSPKGIPLERAKKQLAALYINLRGKSARGKRKDNPFEIWGTGEQVRDFIHIEDVVSATLEAVNQDIQGPVNLGCGRATSFNELAKLVSTEVGYTPEIKHILGAPEGVSYRVCDPSKLLTFYTPKISLEEGIRRAIRS